MMKSMPKDDDAATADDDDEEYAKSCWAKPIKCGSSSATSDPKPLPTRINTAHCFNNNNIIIIIIIIIVIKLIIIIIILSLTL